jgi:hypothetical protein
MKVEEVNIKSVDTKSPDVENRLTALNTRLMTCADEGKVTAEAAAKMFARYSQNGDVAGLTALVIEVEKTERVKQEGQVVTNMPERRGVIAPVVEEEEAGEGDDTAVIEDLLAQFYAAKIQSQQLQTVVTEKFVPITLPSGNLFYGVAEVRAKKLGFSNMKKLSNIMATKSLDIMVDAVAPCLSIDVRQLTEGDFIYFLYWLRTTSLPRTPITMRWRSRYGTTETLSISMTSLKENHIKKTKDKLGTLEIFKSMGFDMPRVYDMLAASTYNADRFDIDELFTIERVQYFNPAENETFGDRVIRVEALLEDELSLLEDLREFRKEFEHGVDEIASVQADTKTFDPAKAAEYLEMQAIRYEAALTVHGYDPKMEEDAEDFRQEAEEIKNKLKKGVGVIPRIEKIRCEIDALSFFSAI